MYHLNRPLIVALLVVCLSLSGCKAKPYYTIAGQAETKKLVVTKKDGSKIEIDIGWAVGGGLWKFISKEEAKNAKGPIVKTIETKGVKFTLTYDPGNIIPVAIKDVFYDGKELGSW
jgi:hypothetical protein